MRNDLLIYSLGFRFIFKVIRSILLLELVLTIKDFMFDCLSLFVGYRMVGLREI